MKNKWLECQKDNINKMLENVDEKDLTPIHTPTPTPTLSKGIKYNAQLGHARIILLH